MSDTRLLKPLWHMVNNLLLILESHWPHFSLLIVGFHLTSVSHFLTALHFNISRTGQKDQKLQVLFLEMLDSIAAFCSFSFFYCFYQFRNIWIDVCTWIWLFLSCTRPVNVVCWRRAICLEFMEKVGPMWLPNTLRFVNSSHIQFVVHGCSLCS